MADPVDSIIGPQLREHLRRAGYVVMPIIPTQTMMNHARQKPNGTFSIWYFYELWMALLHSADPAGVRHFDDAAGYIKEAERESYGLKHGRRKA